VRAASNIPGMRQPMVKRYALARSGPARSHPEEGIRRIRLVRMEAIAEQDQKRQEQIARSAKAA
jgi:hypothetical protein